MPSAFVLSCFVDFKAQPFAYFIFLTISSKTYKATEISLFSSYVFQYSLWFQRVGSQLYCDFLMDKPSVSEFVIGQSCGIAHTTNTL